MPSGAVCAEAFSEVWRGELPVMECVREGCVKLLGLSTRARALPASNEAGSGVLSCRRGVQAERALPGQVGGARRSAVPYYFRMSCESVLQSRA